MAFISDAGRREVSAGRKEEGRVGGGLTRSDEVADAGAEGDGEEDGEGRGVEDGLGEG